MSIYGSNLLSDETRLILQSLRSKLPELQKKRDETRELIKRTRQCSEIKSNGQKCRAYAAHGDTRCNRHGGVKKISLTCRCEAYSFPHRLNGGVCDHPNEPGRKHRPGSRKSKLRQRKLRTKKWLKKIGL